MRILVSSLLIAISLQAAVYYAKVEPKESYTIKAAASGAVKTVELDWEGKVIKDLTIVQLDDELNRVELERSIQKLASLKSMLKANMENIANLEEVAKVKKSQYERIKDLSTKSQVAKEAELIALLNSQNQVISAKSTMYNLQTQITDLTYKIESLEDTISKKRITINEGLLYSLHVKPDDFVNVGAPIAEIHDISEGKLTVYLSADDVSSIDGKTLYLDDVATEIKPNVIWMVADSKNISSYKTQIYIPAPSVFSKLVKVEWK